ncbi:MAG: restriction endonuclease subunit S [Aestuariivita sp.]|nr:restriction endonuclease subunit S [Aestuariivita sp.]
MEKHAIGLLSIEQKDKFDKDGFIVIENAVTSAQLTKLKNVFSEWVEESRGEKNDYGTTLDNRPRFDLQPGHTSEKPGLRRVQSPEEISNDFASVMRQAATVDYCSELIGPAIRFHHGKVNSKLPGTQTEVKFHQDFPFQPMTNDDMITCLLFIDDVTMHNGPLEVVPGSHKGPLYPHWHNGIFTGAVSEDVLNNHKDKVIKCTGNAGSVCLMHVRLLHGSGPNLSNGPRTLYITTYYAEDAIELSPNHLPSIFTHELVRGEPSGRVRCTSFDMILPEVPKDTSFFSQQATDFEK